MAMPEPLYPPSILALAQITERDAQILCALGETGYLTTRQIAALAGFASEKRARRRMEVLHKRGFVQAIARGARGKIAPAWHLSPRGGKALPLFGVTMPDGALTRGAAVLALTLRASQVYVAYRAGDDLAAWTLTPRIAQSRTDDKADRAPRPWAVITHKKGGVKVAIELDRPSRRETDLGLLISRWQTYRAATLGESGHILYLCLDEHRAEVVRKVAEKRGAKDWFRVSGAVAISP